jgi:hypothetical protein
MVSDDAQLFTIEGVAAGLIMILTAYLVVNATSVYTPGDAHLSDMQLEVLGSDALNMMGGADAAGKSPLQEIVGATPSDGERFKTIYMNLINNRTGLVPDRIQFSANVSYRDVSDGSIRSYYLTESRPLTGGEHAVRVTKWVIAQKQLPGSGVNQDRAVLVEVLLWRD